MQHCNCIQCNAMQCNAYLYNETLLSPHGVVPGARWKVTGVRWQVTGNIWKITGERWHMTCDRWNMTGDKWQLTGDSWHGTADTWHMSLGIKKDINVFFSHIKIFSVSRMWDLFTPSLTLFAVHCTVKWRNLQFSWKSEFSFKSISCKIGKLSLKI